MSNRIQQKEKHCRRCNTTKPVADFYRNGHAFTAWCRLCVKDYYSSKNWYRGPRIGRPTPLSAIDRISRVLFWNVRKRSIRSGLPFDLDLESVTNLVRAFCGSHHHSLDSRNPFLPSLDRVNRKKGYLLKNVRVVWLIENLARNTFTDSDVLEFCRRKLGQE